MDGIFVLDTKQMLQNHWIFLIEMHLMSLKMLCAFTGIAWQPKQYMGRGNGGGWRHAVQLLRLTGLRMCCVIYPSSISQRIPPKNIAASKKMLTGPGLHHVSHKFQNNISTFTAFSQLKGYWYYYQQVKHIEYAIKNTVSIQHKLLRTSQTLNSCTHLGTKINCSFHLQFTLDKDTDCQNLFVNSSRWRRCAGASGAQPRQVLNSSVDLQNLKPQLVSATWKQGWILFQAWPSGFWFHVSSNTLSMSAMGSKGRTACHR